MASKLAQLTGAGVGGLFGGLGNEFYDIEIKSGVTKAMTEQLAPKLTNIVVENTSLNLQTSKQVVDYSAAGIYPSGDFKTEMKQIMDFYKNMKGKNPENFTVDVELSK